MTHYARAVAEIWPYILLEDSLRYLLPASAFFVVFWLLSARALRARWLRPERPRWTQIRREMAYSLSTVAIFSATGLFLYVATVAGATRIYTEIDRFGVAYLVASLVLTVLVHDAYFYWTHRMMHHPRIYRYVHRVHHLSHHPSPWAAYAFHPWEALINSLFLPLLTQVLPLHPIAIFAFLTFMILRNVLGHLGIELFPGGFVSRRWTRWNTTTTHHDLHHQFGKDDYALYFTWWDEWFGTTHPRYREVYERITSGRSEGKGSASIVS